MLDEEDQFGALSRQIDLVDSFITDGVRRVEALAALATKRDGDGPLPSADTGVLENSREILRTFLDYRAALMKNSGRLDF